MGGGRRGCSGSETRCQPHRLHRGQAPADGGAWLRALSPPRSASSSACRLAVSSSAVCTCSSASSRSRSVSARASRSAPTAASRESRPSRSASTSAIWSWSSSTCRSAASCSSSASSQATRSWLSAVLQLASRFLEAIRGYARARPVRWGARRPPRPGAAASTAGSAAPRHPPHGSGVGVSGVEAGLAGQAVGRWRRD